MCTENDFELYNLGLIKFGRKFWEDKGLHTIYNKFTTYKFTKNYAN